MTFDDWKADKSFLVLKEHLNILQQISYRSVQKDFVQICFLQNFADTYGQILYYEQREQLLLQKWRLTHSVFWVSW